MKNTRETSLFSKIPNGKNLLKIARVLSSLFLFISSLPLPIVNSESEIQLAIYEDIIGEEARVAERRR